MADRGSGFAARRPGWLVVAALTIAIGLSVTARAPRWEGQMAEVWTTVVRTGDELAAGQLTGTLDGQPLTAAKAYLLAFHHAQDAGDLEHILAVADRLDAASEPDLATHVRRAADSLLEELGR